MVCFVSSFTGWPRSVGIPCVARQRYNCLSFAPVTRRRSPSVYSKASQSGPPEPVVKSSYYKNPSRAIEKGGGFYIPGLRGPRLRFFVGGAALFLLGLNIYRGIDSDGFADGLSATSNFTSNALAILASTIILLTAFRDSRSTESKEGYRQQLKSKQDRPKSLTEDFEKPPEEQTRFSDRSTNLNVDVKWVSDVVYDMHGGQAGIWIFGGNDPPLCTFAKHDLGDDIGLKMISAGPVVKRVGQDTRVLYVDDSSTLPSGIGFPFLREEENWSVLLVPLVRVNSVFVVALPKSALPSITMSVEDRRWIEALAGKVEAALDLEKVSLK
jgi:hypothetical protein